VTSSVSIRPGDGRKRALSVGSSTGVRPRALASVAISRRISRLLGAIRDRAGCRARTARQRRPQPGAAPAEPAL